MKKILISTSIIGVVAAAVIGITVAYFNDTETSTGNIFVAGDLDLKVDHVAQTYNGDDCETCSLTIYSGDGGAKVTDASTNATLYPIVTPFTAPLVTPTSIILQYWTTHPTAKWIWATDPTAVGDDGTNGNVTYTFEHKFNWWGGAVDVDLLMSVAADNQYQIFLNGTLIKSGLGSAEYTTLDPIAEGTFLGAVQPGDNTLKFIVTNLSQTNPAYNTPLYNPGGLLYYLNVERDSADCIANSAFLQNCRLWELKDLEQGDYFWNFGDIKPGDYGTNIISLHAYSNDAFACLITNNVVNADNTLTEPELSLSDDLITGELSPFVKIFAWEESGTPNNIYDSGETILVPVNSPLATAMNPAIALTASNTKYIGLAWCVGTQGLSSNTITCDGSSVGDIAQTDSFTAFITAYIEQQRNNAGFNCAAVQLP